MEKKETVNDRVRILRKFLKMNQAEFAKEIGLSDSTLSRIESGETALTNHNVLLICMQNQIEHNKTVNPEWLRDGKGDMFITPADDNGRPILYDEKQNRLPSEEEELIGVYRELIPANKKHLRDNAKIMLEAQNNTLNEFNAEKGERRSDTSRKSI